MTRPAHATPADTVQACLQLLKANPNHGEALLTIYQACLAEGEQGGKARVEKIIRTQPKNIGLQRVAARLYEDWKFYDRQVALLDKLYQQGIRSESFYDDYARSLKNTGKPQQCRKIADEALAQYPDSLTLLRLRANANFWLGRHEEALADGEKILQAAPEDHYVRTTVGSLKLMLSDCREGFADYAAHRDVEIARSGLVIANDLPQWEGQPLQGTRLLLWVSQGIGDVVMFAGLIPWLSQQDVQVTLAVYEKAMPLFARSFPDIEVVTFIPELLAKPAGRFDCHAPLGQLMPYALPHYTPSEHRPYLQADAALTERLRKSYQSAAGEKKLVGISWHTTNPDTFAQRNIPLAQWQPLCDLEHVQIVSLQYGDHRQEIEAINRRRPGTILLDDTVDAFGNTDALAAQIAAMDAVVSIQNSTVHLAGALGVPTTILLSAASEWRWGVSGTSNRWYRSVTLERQDTLLDWTAPLQRCCDRLVKTFNLDS